MALACWFLEKADVKEDALQILEASEAKYVQEPISRAVAQAVYGRCIEGSVTHLERFAGCAYAHFLQYGLIFEIFFCFTFYSRFFFRVFNVFEIKGRHDALRTDVYYRAIGYVSQLIYMTESKNQYPAAR